VSAGVPIREATPRELRYLDAIEQAAGMLFIEVGIGPLTGPPPERNLALAAAVFVAGDPPVGFAQVEIDDGTAHLEELAVRPDHGRRGLGTALVERVCQWAAGQAYPAVTLLTYRDVAWNGPFYTRLGFTPTRLTPGLARRREAERALGLDRWGARVAMRRAVCAEDGLA
jgi:GNAT superfamily N-acetyltransferase